MSIATTERAIYEEAWTLPAYREWSPGADAVTRFLRLTHASPLNTVIDFGCGTGRGAAALREEGFLVTLTDQTDAGLEVRDLPFVAHCLWAKWPAERAYYGYCCDVLEHIPTELTALTIARMLEACRLLYLEVATVPDRCGLLIGQPLHKTVKPFVWWRDLCAEIGDVKEGVDLLHRAVFVLEGR